MKLFNRVKLLRIKKGFTQQLLADKIGISRQAVGLIERGEMTPSIVIGLKISFVLNEPVAEIFFVDEE